MFKETWCGIVRMSSETVEIERYGGSTYMDRRGACTYRAACTKGRVTSVNVVTRELQVCRVLLKSYMVDC